MTRSIDLFINAIEWGGGAPSIECKCGKTHLCPDSDYEFDVSYRDDGPEQTWREHCEEWHKEDPDHVVLHYGYDGVEYKDFDNKIFVYGCDCWRDLNRYEEWIWANRSTISGYINSRIDQLATEAEHAKLLKILKEPY